MSFLWDLYFYIRNSYAFYFQKSTQTHLEKLAVIQKQIKESDPKKKLCTSRPSWMTMSVSGSTYKDSGAMNQINLQPLRDIVEVDVKRGIVRCEPNVTCGQITHCLNAIGYTLKIIPELDDLTVGGLAAGSGIESSSHRHGLFQDICVGFEMVLADGTIINASKDENPDLFAAIPWSYGTLGFVTCVDLEMIPCKKYVHLKYIPCKTLKEAQDLLIKECDGDHLFIEALLFKGHKTVVMLGDLTDNAEWSKTNSIGYFWKEWFYSHVLGTFGEKGGEEFIPLRHYYHRHTKSIFWEMEDILPFGNHWAFRWTFGWLVPPKISLLKLTQTPALHELYKKHHVIQDMLVPLDLYEQSIKKFDEEWGIYPIWVCPTKMPKTARGFTKNKTHTEMFVDLGAYGVPHAKKFECVSSHRAIEQYVRDVNGFQLLYADTFMDRKEFDEMFDTKLYQEQRKKLKCESRLPDVFDKVCKSARN
jgi:delta24-sterol reductase